MEQHCCSQSAETRLTPRGRGFIGMAGAGVGEVKRKMLETQTNFNHTEAYVRAVQASLEKSGDVQTAGRVKDLAERLAGGATSVTVAFCGLFSAGKSSLLNALVGADELATGAVPTTADVAQVTLPRTDGSVQLLDTPGVDSTDESHQAATEAALHRADVIGLVMDYQHVEAEDNLVLARSFCDQGKRLVLIVNQIDKHLEWEMPFTEFQSSVSRTLENWDISPERIFYTATRPTELNQLEDLAAYLRALQESSTGSLVERVLESLHELVVSHVDASMAERQVAVEEALAQAGALVPYEQDEAEQMRRDLTARRDARSQALTDARKQLQAEQADVQNRLLRSVELAQISPYATTELGRLYIESLRPDFRPGWFRQKQRAVTEQVERLRKFVEDLAGHTQKYLVWPQQGNLRSWVESTDWADAAWLSDIDSLSVPVTEEVCTHLVKTGALVSEQYPYQYVKDVVDHLKRNFSSRLLERLERWFDAALVDLEESQATERREVDRVQNQLAAVEAWLQLQRDWTAEIAVFLQTDAGHEGGEAQ